MTRGILILAAVLAGCATTRRSPTEEMAYKRCDLESQRAIGGLVNFVDRVVERVSLNNACMDLWHMDQAAPTSSLSPNQQDDEYRLRF